MSKVIITLPGLDAGEAKDMVNMALAEYRHRREPVIDYVRVRYADHGVDFRDRKIKRLERCFAALDQSDIDTEDTVKETTMQMFLDYTDQGRRPTAAQIVSAWKKAGKPSNVIVTYGETRAEFERCNGRWYDSGNGCRGVQRDKVVAGLVKADADLVRFLGGT